ncbi:HAMP domain-containing sensor histidine kinase [Brevibacillus sp. FSL K6-0770]|uniref:sensor histidine kinase n=1 Tax=Brevibacillus TaxID=55080 RepID=UPI001F6069A2|nr:HAMP domain-containing sensor histidine kinase [Brevibacillus parabrevis]
MNLRKKLIIQYVRQFFGFLLVLLLCLIGSLIVLGYRLMNEELETDLSRLVASDLRMQLEWEQDKISVNDRVKKSVDSHNGWLQIIDPKGTLLYAYRTPATIPQAYEPGEWITQTQNDQASAYYVKHWVVEQELSEQKVIVLYGTPAPENALMAQLLAAKPTAGSPVPAELANSFSREKGWYAIYDRQGKLVAEYNAADAAKQLDLIPILQNGKESRNVPVITTSRYDKASGFTYIVGVANPWYRPGAAAESVDNMIAYSFLQVGAVLIVSVLLAGSWYALRVGKPLLHMVNWLGNLAQGRYAEPIGKNGRRIGTTRKGKRKKSFAVFQDIFDALAKLSHTLQTNEERQKDIEKTREEWISGLSHDLKTPLSSIFGYATMLESEQYEWGRAEVNQFGRTIREKADYMNGLIEDLNLTYRLKNHALPLMKEPVSVVEAIRRMTADLVNEPSASGHEIEFEAQEEKIVALLDPKWFSRIVINILTNAIRHTPKGTLVRVEVSLAAPDSFAVRIADNGPGMDEKTKASLFERYYRGGHTKEDTSGTGLGMAIAKQLVLAHAGNIEVKSEPGKGTEVVMTFPCQTQTASHGSLPTKT